MRIVIVSDAWTPQINGVVRTLRMTCKALSDMGHAVQMITPDLFRSLPCPTYPEIRLALGAGRRMARLLQEAEADAIHISTEGPLGMAARAWCLQRNIGFTTAWHTNFPDYVALRTGVPASLLYKAMRRFHAPSLGVMVATDSVAAQLRARGISNIRRWSRGVDLESFHPDPAHRAGTAPRLLYVGRIAVEKNIEAFLSLGIAGEKRVVGEGPAREGLRRRHPDAVFTGALSGEALRAEYAAADVFVFPSRTDTFGLVMLEALACGTPVAAFPVQGPLDVIGRDGRGIRGGADPVIGCLDDDLETAVRGALMARRADCRRYALHFGWAACSRQFVENLAPLATAERQTAA